VDSVVWPVVAVFDTCRWNHYVAVAQIKLLMSIC
jgi:hypothetical protein